MAGIADKFHKMWNPPEDEMDYEYEDGDEMELVLDERGDDRLIYRNDMPPAGCRACGGPYPNCKASCKMFGN